MHAKKINFIYTPSIFMSVDGSLTWVCLWSCLVFFSFSLGYENKHKEQKFFFKLERNEGEK